MWDCSFERTDQLSHMKHREALSDTLIQLLTASKYLLQVSLDSTGKVLSFSPSFELPLFSSTTGEKAIYFSDCFLTSDWQKFKENSLKAALDPIPSFRIELHKIDHATGRLLPTVWEFTSLTNAPETWAGIGFPVMQEGAALTTGGITVSLDKKEELIDSLFEDRLIGFWEFEPSHQKEILNSDLTALLGYREDDAGTGALGSKPAKMVIHPEDYSDLVAELSDHFKIKTNLTFRRNFRISTDREHDIAALCFGKTVLWTDTGLPKKVWGCIMDVSERKKQESWLYDHYGFLKDLAFQQSHSLRARVANILGILEILDSEIHGTELRRLVKIIKDETKQLDRALKKSIKESVEENQSFEKEILPD